MRNVLFILFILISNLSKSQSSSRYCTLLNESKYIDSSKSCTTFYTSIESSDKIESNLYILTVVKCHDSITEVELKYNYMTVFYCSPNIENNTIICRKSKKSEDIYSSTGNMIINIHKKDSFYLISNLILNIKLNTSVIEKFKYYKN